jgi:hypothetical protein
MRLVLPVEAVRMAVLASVMIVGGATTVRA